MTEECRQSILATIAANVRVHGYHLQIVDGGPSPRFMYTIGLHHEFGFELVFAGGAIFTPVEIKSIFVAMTKLLREIGMTDSIVTTIEGLGTFKLGKVDPSWSAKLLLGALNFLGLSEVKAFQITPDEDHWTIDVPNLSQSREAGKEPIWKWLEGNWSMSFSAKSKVITNLDALRGFGITEVMRWDELEWEMFSGAGPEVAKEEMRKVPLAMLIAFDESLHPVVDLEIGTGIWREEIGGEWYPWKSAGNS